MTAPTKRDQRLKERRSLREKAPVAAQFEDCFQAFQQLSDSILVNRSDLSLYAISKDCALRFKLWGDDSGASSRALDHGLANSPVVRAQTQRLLTDLNQILELGEFNEHARNGNPR